MTSVRLRLENGGYIELLDSFGNVALEFCDHEYAGSIRNGDSLQKCYEFLHSIAIEENHLFHLEGNWASRGSEGRLFREIPWED